MKGEGKKKAFLAAYTATASVTKAADAAKIHRRLHYKWLEADSDYVAAFQKAQSEAAQLLEDEAVRRAHEGVVEPIFYKGRPTGATRVYSDPLLMFLLRGLRPETYRERVAGSIELSGPAGAPIPLKDERLALLSDDELASLVTLAGKLQPSE